MASRVRTIIETSGCVESKSFTTAAGFSANRKINIDHIVPGSNDFNYVVGALKEQIEAYAPDAITAVPDGANPFGLAVAQLMDIEFIALNKDMLAQGEATQQHSGVERIAIIEDVRSSGISTLKAARAVGLSKVVLACAIVDRGQEAPTVLTIDDALEYGVKYPNQPPAHITVPFIYETLLNYPLALRVEG